MSTTEPGHGTTNWNVPNALTTLRIVMVPFFAWALLVDGGDSVTWRLVAFGIFLTAFFFYFFAAHWEAVLDFAKSLVPSKNRERVLYIAGKMDAAIAGFVRGLLPLKAAREA